MMSCLSENLGTLIVAAALLALVARIALKLIRDARAGKCVGCDCGGCSAGCAKKTKFLNEYDRDKGEN